MKPVEYWIERLNLEPHPEGGFYSRIFESKQPIVTPAGKRPSATAIHYLLEKDDFSSWHRIQHDEIWFFHAGMAITVHEISQSGELSSRFLCHEHDISLTVKGGTWFCAEPSQLVIDQQSVTYDYGLVSCVVSPGFDFLDFEMASKTELVSIYPQHRDIINRLCRH
jgi:predicted cupin superfamily sugar epimerase